MTGFAFTDTPDNPRLRSFGHDLLPSTLGETLGAVTGDPTLTPSRLIGTQVEIEREAGRLPETDRPILTEGVEATATPVGIEEDREGLSELLPADRANAEFKDFGVTFDRPVRRNVARILARQKREEQARADIIARGPRGFFTGAAQLGAGFAVAAIDPLNVAAALVPGLRASRFAGIAARLGKTTGRFARGFSEGALGNLAIEPGVFALSQSQQLDYDLLDSFVNVTFGGFIGGGLHVTSGAIRARRSRMRRPSTLPPADDVVSRLPSEMRDRLLSTSAIQLARGQTVDIEPIIRSDLLRPRSPIEGDTPSPGIPPGELITRSAGGRGAQEAIAGEASPVERTAVPLVDRQGAPRIFGTERSARKAARGLRGDVEARPTDDGRFALFRQVDIVPERMPDGSVRAFRTNRAAERFIRQTRPEEAEGLAVVPFGPVGQRRFAVVRGADEATLRGIQARPDLVEFAEVTRDPFKPATRSPLAVEAAQEIARRESLPERDGAADFEAAREADSVLERIPGEPDEGSAAEEADFASQRLEEAIRAGLLDERQAERAREISQEGSRIVQDAERMGEVGRVAAECLTRRR